MRCDGTGRKIGDIELDEKGERLYSSPKYVTENKMNGDIVVSDVKKRALVVVDRSGRHRFDYKGHPMHRFSLRSTWCLYLLTRTHTGDVSGCY